MRTKKTSNKNRTIKPKSRQTKKFPRVAAEFEKPSEALGAEATEQRASTGDKKTLRKQKSEKLKKVSALGAAARVVSEKGEPMNCQEMIAAMAEKGYWKSANGQTPAATLYSAILRELAKPDKSRFVKAARGKFELARAK